MVPIGLSPTRPPQTPAARSATHTPLPGEPEPQAPSDQATVSRSGGSSIRKWSLVALAALGIGAMTIATTSAPPGVAQAMSVQTAPTTQQSEQLSDGAPFALYRHNGEVVVNVGIGDQVIFPNGLEGDYAHYRLPGAEANAVHQDGESVCKQALDLGGARCAGENAAYLQSPSGTVFVEQTGVNTLHIVNADGADITVESQPKGVDAKASYPDQFIGGAHFYNDGQIGHY
ncbi:MAG: hypothetical protein AB7S38_33255 [Vulcanimicrobiota bacterium]